MRTATMAIEAESGADAAPKTRLLTLDHLDGRTRAARRAKALAEAFERELGGQLSPAQQVACARAASLVVLAESVRTRARSDGQRERRRAR